MSHETNVWREAVRFDLGREDVTVVEDSSRRMPGGSKDFVTEKYRAGLEKKKTELECAKPGTKYVISDYPETGGLALYEVLQDSQQRKVMWPGTAARLEGFDFDGNKIQLRLGRTNYAELTAQKDPAYRQLFERNGLSLPSAALGVCVAMETPEGLIIQTRRGIDTPVYTGRLYLPGGNHEKIETHPADEIFSEIEEETGLTQDDFDPTQLRFLGIVMDRQYEGGALQKPDLVAYMKIPMTFNEIEESFSRKIVPKNPKDVWNLEPAPTGEAGLARYLQTHESDHCPPSHGGLAFVGARKYGELWLDKLVRDLGTNKFSGFLVPSR